MHVPKEKRSKLDNKVEKCIFVSYKDGIMLGMYHILCMELNKQFSAHGLGFVPWFSNSIFGIGVSEVGKNIILYCKHFV